MNPPPTDGSVDWKEYVDAKLTAVQENIRREAEVVKAQIAAIEKRFERLEETVDRNTGELQRIAGAKGGQSSVGQVMLGVGAITSALIAAAILGLQLLTRQ